MAQDQVTNGKKVHMISLGCSRNRVDAEVMLGTLGLKGYRVIEEPKDADAIIINTCGFIGSAKEESIETILSCGSLKEHNPKLKLVVTGCLTQRYKSQLAKGLPEVDFFVGTDEFPRIGELLEGEHKPGEIFAKRSHYIYNANIPRINTLYPHSAYVKVAEGCEHQCSFCIIPAIRGKLRSRPIDNIIQEVEKLAENGVKEINLIAQDLAAYGRDLKNDTSLLALLKALVKIDGIHWIRPLYIYPENISDEFLEFLATEPKLLKYLDIPVQHASDSILKSMRREINREGLNKIFAKLRTRIPDLAIRTSVMVGYPGETEDDFRQLKEFVAEQKFTHLGCFTYSKEEGTLAARLKDQVDEATALRRQEEIMLIQQSISRDFLAGYVGKEFPIIVDGVSEESDLLLQGRLPFQAPEVDGVVLINDGPVKIGEIQKVLITEAMDYDLVGEIIEESNL